jgi:hypothetical protein
MRSKQEPNKFLHLLRNFLLNKYNISGKGRWIGFIIND